MNKYLDFTRKGKKKGMKMVKSYAYTDEIFKYTRG